MRAWWLRRVWSRKSNAGCSSINWWLARWTRLPAPVNPQPLTGEFANHAFQHCMQTARVFGRIIADFNGRIESQNIALLGFEPQRKARDYGGARPRGDLCKSCIRAGGGAEEVYKDTFLQRRILIDQD